MTEWNYHELSFWHDSLEEPLNPRPSLEGALRADVAVVGAGYTGLWTAWYLKHLDPALKIVVLEAEIAGFGASGRNGGWCSAWLSGIEHWLDDPSSRESAVRLQRLMFRTVQDIGEICEREAIDCHYERSGALITAVNEAQVKRLEAELRYLFNRGFEESDYRRLRGAERARSLDIDHALAVFHTPHCAAVHPARLARGLAQRLERRQVAIFEHSPVIDLQPGRLLTPQGRVAADTVIVATEGYGAGLEGQRRRLIPVHSMMVATEPLPPEVFEELRFDRRYCFGSLDHVVTYGQRTADDRIAFGCRGRYFYGSGLRRRFDAHDPEFDQVRQTLHRLFPRLREQRFTHAWGGALGVSRSRRPAVCYDPRRRLGWAGGYFGNGVAAAHLAGQTLADLVMGRDSERVCTPWVNPPEAARHWEPEPLRWLGFRAARTLMERMDRAESHGRESQWLQKLLDLIMG